MTSENQPKKSSPTLWYVVAVVVIIVIIGVAVYVLTMRPGSTTPATVTMTLYEGEVSTTQYGFGNSASSLASPGPTLTFKNGDVVQMTVYNVGTMPHSWAISTTPNTSGQILFNSEINPGTYIAAGQSGTVTFTVNQAGSFYYVCPIPGHTDLGMYGSVTVNP